MVYKDEAVKIIDGISCFCEVNDYVENYDKIAQEEIKGLKEEGRNPFMDEEPWKNAEQDTADICNQYIKPGDKILDVGCGTGRMLSYFADVEKYGIDISIDMVKMSRGKGIEACMGNVEKLPYCDETFDMVICTDVLEHVFDLHKTLLEINRVVKAGGYIILRVPQNEDLNQYLQPSYPFEYVHLRMFSKSSLELYCTKVFKMKFLQAKDTYEALASIKLRRFLGIFPVLFTKIALKGMIIIFPKLCDNKKIRNIFEKKTMRFVEIIEAFKKSE